QLNAMIEQVAAHPETPLGRLSLLPEAELKLLDSFNQRATPFPHTTLVGLFAAQVAATPEAIAIVEEEGTLIDYRMLDDWSDRIAAQLLAEGLAIEEIVPLVVDRCAAFYAGLLGIMKAGGAVLPIDVATPAARLTFMLQDCGARRLLVEKGLESPPSALPLLPVERLRNGDPAPLAPPPRAPNNLAYVIYTSGSTGQPKGVLVEHGGFVNMTLAQIRAFEVREGDRVVQFASPSFDASLSEIFMALLAGAALVPVRLVTIHDPERLLNHFQTTGVNVATLPPVYLHALCAGGDPPAILALKTLITAGEPPILEDALRLSAKINYFNAYGPTETSVCASMQRVYPDPERYPHGQIPIGPPLENLSIHLVDGAGELVPLGVPGEIRVAGVGVARGYLNRPELTSERFFIQQGQTVERVYATGDLGRWLEDGTLELLGRGDDQVKIRGNRVEPGEVVHQLLQHPLVHEAAVLVERDDLGNAELVAFVTPATLAAESPRAWLEPRLPAYMLPNRWVTLDKLPLSINGKVDRQALRRLAREACRESGAITPPATPLEMRIARVWHKILGRENIGTTEDFFTLGGDSIKAIQVVAALRDLKLETKDLFLYPTIAALARAAEQPAHRSASEPSDDNPVTGVLPLTAIQAWFFTDYPIDHHHFNHGEYLFFDTPLDEQALLASLTAVQRHHDMLRACFRVENGTITQTIQDVDFPVDFELIDLRGMDAVERRMDQLTRALQSGINLSSGPLFKTRLFRLDGEERLLFVIHHLIIDAVSWRFLLDDILRGYEQSLAGQTIVLPPKGGSFQKWAFGIAEYSRGAALLAELTHWRTVDELPTPPIPGFIEPDPAGVVAIVDENITLTVAETEGLLAMTRRAGAAYRMIDALLASLAHSLRQLTQTTRTPIMLESHGREPLVANLDISRTVGWFTSVFSFVLTHEDGTSPAELCRIQREALEKIPNRGIGYGILRHLTPGVTLNQKPRISFNFLGEYRLDGGALTEKVRGDLAPYRASDRAPALYDLMFNAIVEGGQLQIFVAHDARAFPPAAIQALLDPMRSFLLNLVQSTHAGLAPLS
ncbi:MAG: amino acid adenylation domain-containing protein, partial [Magnetococcales bacterium]|nr:amino acid adenylation domain-containing protein [Magnetococcales bacterium]